MKFNKNFLFKTVSIIAGVFVLLIIGILLFTSPPTSIELEKDLSVHEITINDTIGNHELKGRMWQSAETAKQNQSKGIILISHGFSSRAESMVMYASALAKSGYIVAGVTHDDIPLLKTGEVLNDPMLARQRHLALLLEEIYTTSDNSNIRNVPVGLLGYSLGSFSVLHASGVKSDFTNQESYCQTDLGKQNIIMCNPRFTERMQAIQSAEKINYPQLTPSAIAVLAPAYTPLFDTKVSVESTSPTLMIYGTLDEYVNASEVEQFAKDSNVISKQKRLDAVGHYAYLPACSFPQSGEHCDDPQKIDRAVIQQEVAGELVTFFDDNMK